VLFYVICVICVLCLNVVPLPSSKNPFAVKINNNNNNNKLIRLKKHESYSVLSVPSGSRIGLLRELCLYVKR
jgi:hypothetical protein